MVYAILTRSIVSVKENEAWFHLGRSHKLSDVVEQLRNTREDASEERVCLMNAHPGREHIIAEEQRREFSFGICEKCTGYDISMGERGLHCAPEVNSKRCRESFGE
uniref:Uncharacterized protein n=1 Tax=Brassica oleracea TaxID=3712 RepID=A0A3P6EAL0_BRAOL|nr:unnamed protein product [Brassica oleracea]